MTFYKLSPLKATLPPLSQNSILTESRVSPLLQTEPQHLQTTLFNLHLLSSINFGYYHLIHFLKTFQNMKLLTSATHHSQKQCLIKKNLKLMI